MVLLIHHPVSAASRKVRIIMAEKRMLFVLKEEEPWKPSQDLYKLNPSGEVPVFVFDGNVIAGNYAITEFLEEVNREIRLMPADPKQKAEVRRLIEWFDVKFMREVNRNIVYEKVHKRFGFGNPPDSKILKIGINNLNFHLEYIDWPATIFRWPTLPQPHTCRLSTIWATFRGTATKTPSCGIRK